MARHMQSSASNPPDFRHDEVLVAILNSSLDYSIAREQHWYRIPVRSADKWLSRRWPPGWVAFYMTKVFGPDAFAVSSYARVLEVRQVMRLQLLPDEPDHPKSGERYYQLLLGPIEKLPRPIPSRRWRRIIFIPTTWKKFTAASEINELFDDSPLENALWEHLRKVKPLAERQELVTANGVDYFLDFAFHCSNGKSDVETDGDAWHSSREQIEADNRRDNDLETGGWRLLRFNSSQLKEKAVEYCVPLIAKNVRKLGGLSEDRMIPWDIAVDGAQSQLSLFDDQG